MPEYQCSWTRYLYFSDYLSMVELGGNIVIQNLLDIEIHIDQLSIENIIFYNGQLVPDSGKINRNIKLYINSVQLIECFLSINYVELGEIVKLQAHNSHVSVTNSNNVIFTSCTFHDFDKIPWPTAIVVRISQIPIARSNCYYRPKP